MMVNIPMNANLIVFISTKIFYYKTKMKITFISFLVVGYLASVAMSKKPVRNISINLFCSLQLKQPLQINKIFSMSI